MPIEAPSKPNSMDVTFTSVGEQYVQMIRAGQNPTMEEFIARYPHFQREIRLEFPTILLAEQLHRSTKKRANAEAEIPAKIGNYRVTSEIGRGGMGRVFAGYHQTMKRAVAIKVLSIVGSDRSDAIRRFDREARAAGQLNHPNIVQVFDYGTQDNFLYIVMHRVRGLDLARIISGLSDEKQKSGNRSLAMDWRMIAQIGTQVASAIGHAHEKGMIHRDIKPANLMMETNGHTWVTDFGLVKVPQGDLSLSRTGDLIGTPRYMAPEQLRGISDARSDIYGLGITLYELATGQRAWDDLSGQEILTKRSTLELPAIHQVNPTVPTSLCDIIMKCCAFRPEDRYQTAAELHYVLNRYTHGQRVGDRRKTRNGDRTIMNRKPIRIARIAATLAGVGLFSWWLIVATRKPNPYKDPVAALSILKNDEVRTEFIKQLPSIIEEVVNNNDPKFRNVVGDLAEEAMNKSFADLNMPSDKKELLMGKVDTIIKEYKDGKYPVMSAEEFHGVQMQFASDKAFGEAGFLLQQSDLPPQEKYMGQQWLALFYRGIAENRYSEEALARLKDYYATNLLAIKDSESVRGFMKLVETETTAIGGSLKVVDSRRMSPPPSAVIVDKIDDLLKDPKVGRLIHELQTRPVFKRDGQN